MDELRSQMSRVKLMAPPGPQYDDHNLYGARQEALKLLELSKLDNCSECVMFPIGTYVDKQQWTIKNLVGLDKRLKTMTETIKVQHALPLQRYAWPHIEKGDYPLVFVSPEATGKTYTHLLFMVSKLIKSIPISVTDEMISTPEELDAFSAEELSKPNKPQVQTEIPDIDQKNFDYNSLSETNSNVVDSKTVEQESVKPTNEWYSASEDTYQVGADGFDSHPKYIIICSNQQNVEDINRHIINMKVAVYGNKTSEARLRHLSPISRTINVHQDDEKLALRCNESNILIGTPGAFIKCFNARFLNFNKCSKVFFDDMDLALQLNNSHIREIAKFYLAQTEYIDDDDDNPNSGSEDSCQMYIFSRKWTDLVKQFVNTIFVQTIIMFSSIIEASLYVNTRFDIEIMQSNSDKISKLENSLKIQCADLKANDKIAILCSDDTEAQKLTAHLEKLQFNVKFLPEETPLIALRSRSTFKPIYVLSDAALELVADILNDVTILIHYSLPKEWLVFDQRFRSMYRNISDLKKALTTIVFIKPKIDLQHAKNLYDILSRSTSTLNSTKLELRDLILSETRAFCWRWATTGVCRLEKLNRDDRFGSYCPYRHSLIKPSTESPEEITWPKIGQFKVTITYLRSPNEFYFWFESHRDFNSTEGEWRKLESTGRTFMAEIQSSLDKLKDSPTCSVSLDDIKKGRVFGIYLAQEARVDRIIILDDLSRDDNQISTHEQSRSSLRSNLAALRYHIEYSRQVKARKIDYGTVIDVYLRNIFYLPPELLKIRAQSHRGFNLGVKPTGGEPDWPYKAKKQFYDLVSVNNLYEVTVWMRLSNNGCFWFDHMAVARKLISFENNKTIVTDPLKELCNSGLAVPITSEPSFLNPSTRLRTTQRWNADKLASKASYAFIQDIHTTDDLPAAFLLRVENNLEIWVRHVKFNRILIKLEQNLLEDFNAGKFPCQDYLAEGVYCLARIPEGNAFTINRCRINKIIKEEQVEWPAGTGQKYMIECLDHGDRFWTNKSFLFQVPAQYVTCLPFQAIKTKLTDLRPDIVQDIGLRDKLREELYSLAWDNRNQMLGVRYSSNKDRHVHLYLEVNGELDPFVRLLETRLKTDIFINKEPKLREILKVPVKQRDVEENKANIIEPELLLRHYILDIILDIAKDELALVS